MQLLTGGFMVIPITSLELLQFHLIIQITGHTIALGAFSSPYQSPTAHSSDLQQEISRYIA